MWLLAVTCLSTETNSAPPPAPGAVPRVLSKCPKCGTLNNGKSSCCGLGGAWFEKCAKKVSDKFSYTWSEGVQSCKTKSKLVHVQLSDAKALCMFILLLPHRHRKTNRIGHQSSDLCMSRMRHPQVRQIQLLCSWWYLVWKLRWYRQLEI